MNIALLGPFSTLQCSLQREFAECRNVWRKSEVVSVTSPKAQHMMIIFFFSDELFTHFILTLPISTSYFNVHR